MIASESAPVEARPWVAPLLLLLVASTGLGLGSGWGGLMLAWATGSIRSGATWLGAPIFAQRNPALFWSTVTFYECCALALIAFDLLWLLELTLATEA